MKSFYEMLLEIIILIIAIIGGLVVFNLLINHQDCDIYHSSNTMNKYVCEDGNIYYKER